jgi:hypothetical protein
VCTPGLPLDVSAVTAVVTGVTEAPAACTADKQDRKRVRKVLKQMKTARKKLLRAANAAAGEKRDSQIAKVDAKLAKASGLLANLAAQLSAACHAAMAEQVGQAQAQTGCLSERT